MAELIFSNPDLDVFGGPASIDLSVDFGATGRRGSFIWSGTLPPEQQLVNQEVFIGDFYINTNTGVVFEYTLQVGNPVWARVFNLSLPQVSQIIPVAFDTGVGQIVVPTAIINPYETIEPELQPVVVEDLVIRYNIENQNPVSSGFTPIIQTVNGVELLIITLTAVEFDLMTNTWIPLNGLKNIHGFVTWLGGGN
jgi:hypothetical protein